MQNQMTSQPNRTTELWVGISKNKRLSILNNESFMIGAGLTVMQRVNRVDNFVINNSITPITIRGFGLKSSMAISLLSQGKLDCVIVGRDTAKEFNLASKGEKGTLQSVELLDLDMSRCALTVAVKDNDTAQKPTDLNGRNVVTQYPQILKNWASMNNVQFGNIISCPSITGGVEGYSLFDPSVTVIADLVQSGDSLVQNGWKPLGIKQPDWDAICFDRDKQFIDLTAKRLEAISGVALQSSAIFARNSKKLSQSKESAIGVLEKRLEKGAKAIGNDPVSQFKVVAFQRSQKPRWDGVSSFRDQPPVQSYTMR